MRDLLRTFVGNLLSRLAERRRRRRQPHVTRLDGLRGIGVGR